MQDTCPYLVCSDSEPRLFMGIGIKQEKLKMLRAKRFYVLLFVTVLFSQVVLCENAGPWNLTELFEVPQIFPAPNLMKEVESGLQPVFFEGENFRGAETRVFAWIGIPEGNGPFPAMVLIHGGGGTAYKEWVKLWMDRGYAAVAVDTAGQIPVHPEGEKKKWSPHEHSGPRGWGGFDQIDDPIQDQWPYHAVVAAIRGHSLLRSFPEVDEARIERGQGQSAHINKIGMTFPLVTPILRVGCLRFAPSVSRPLPLSSIAASHS